MINIGLVILSFWFMEFVAWSNHKYIMHGFLWKWHKDHHRKDHQKSLPLKTEEKTFEKNDLFFLVYAIPAIILLLVGFSVNNFAMVYIGVGITLYGFTYFVIHDLIIHKRINVSFLNHKHSSYIKAIIKAHTAHHKPKTKADFNNYGLLIFSAKYFNK